MPGTVYIIGAVEGAGHMPACRIHGNLLANSVLDLSLAEAVTQAHLYEHHPELCDTLAQPEG